MRYGTGSSRLRHNDRGNPSSNTNSQESLRALTKALLDQSEDRSLFLGLGVKLSNDHPCRAHCSLRGRGPFSGK